MATIPALLTVEDFAKLTWEDGRKRELRHGEIVEKPVARFVHEIVKSNTNLVLVGWSIQTGSGIVFPESEYKLDADTAYFPDLSWLSNDRIAAMDPERIAVGAPDLAVEVVSSESAGDLESKIEDYLARGSRAVWVLYPEQRVLRVHDRTGSSRLLRASDWLEDPELLPGFRIPVSRFFERLPAA
jgi:Uma2 family endonuclease